MCFMYDLIKTFGFCFSVCVGQWIVHGLSFITYGKMFVGSDSLFLEGDLKAEYVMGFNVRFSLFVICTFPYIEWDVKEL